MISPELQEVIDMTFGNENDNTNTNSDEEEATNEESGIVASSKFIQLSGIKADVESTSADRYYPNNGNSVVFRETTVWKLDLARDHTNVNVNWNTIMPIPA